MRLRCNHCLQGLDALAYRTVCKHLLCPLCAKTCFEQHSDCPICSTRLRASEVEEVALVGNKTDQALPCSVIYSLVLAPSIVEMHEKLGRVLMALTDVMEFFAMQHEVQSLSSQQQEESLQNLLVQKDSQIETLANQLSAQERLLAEMNNKSETDLAEKAQEINQLNEVLQDKVRKCHAWEKAYNNIRNQLQRGNPAPSMINVNPAPPYMEMPPQINLVQSTAQDAMEGNQRFLARGVDWEGPTKGNDAPMQFVSQAYRMSSYRKEYPNLTRKRQLIDQMRSLPLYNTSTVPSSFMNQRLSLKPQSMYLNPDFDKQSQQHAMLAHIKPLDGSSGVKDRLFFDK